MWLQKHITLSITVLEFQIKHTINVFFDINKRCVHSQIKVKLKRLTLHNTEDTLIIKLR